MKANKAPEKIYLSAVDLEEIGYLLEDSNDSQDVEYTRTDAFIEKADKFISTFFHPDDKELIDAVLKGFHKHMKGE